MTKIYITDLEAYNSGHLIGDWIELPLRPHELYAEVRSILIKGKRTCKSIHHHEEIFITDFECDYKDIGEYDDVFKLNELAEQMEELDEDTQDKLKALEEAHGENYYKDLDSKLEVIEGAFGMVIDGVSSDYELARKLEYTNGYEDELYQILGCSHEAYEQLSSFIRTDDIAHTIDTEFHFVYVNNTAFEVVA